MAEPRAIGIKYPDGVVAVSSSCTYCGTEIFLIFYARDVLPQQEFIKYLCSECGFETLIPIEDEWR